MHVKSLLARPFAGFIYNKIKKEMASAVEDQKSIRQYLIKSAQHTVFGKDHGFETIKTYEDFKNQIPVRDYEALKSYVEKVKEGKQNILWKGKPLYFAKTSGTTSGAKYIPISKESISNHINTARNALLCYIAQTKNADFTAGKMIFLSGSPELDRIGGVPSGRLSGIVNHHVPPYLRTNQLPKYETNCIEDWETKLDKIVEETSAKDMTLISGIPPWVQMYFDRLIEKHGKKVSEIFPNFSLLVYGGVNFEPYKQKLFESIGKEIDSIELFPASEGFFAFQDTQTEKGMLLNTNSGIFFEFIPADEYGKPGAKRLSLEQVELDQNYALIISNNAGLWAYDIGDTVRFVSLDPYRIVVTGRTKHFISAFGEHVIGEEVDYAMQAAAGNCRAKITEFTVAPMVVQGEGKSYHEWLIEFESAPENIEQLALTIDNYLRKKNTYYDDLIAGGILQPLKITPVKKDGFINYMRSIGKLGGQNKLPRLSNDRKIADALKEFLI
ncbi:GH3 auxin-responsive promoter family protein [Arachidicoccus terrestris]|uniref:GH3 auxin-responsive promoter family protein n=1 Tax=Arachidicoccus terrestris TaxID=2875539 RepID=UPI001CC7C1D1|nr:GH3 auxin-responsive promoter family protein [Arachidicoccus terrestris]UAY56580.1 GH3 auxin-responsive promoter family protein [Arachidicoccus terrestris]